MWHAALGALACLAADLSSGQPQDPASPALYEGADRTARLVAGAKREGSLSLYASLAEKDLIRLVSEFERRYGIKVNVWRSGKSNVLRRAVTEARAGRFEADVVCCRAAIYLRSIHVDHAYALARQAQELRDAVAVAV